MNVRINLALFIILILAFIVGAGVRFDASWGRFSMAEWSLKDEVFYGVTAICIVFFGVKAVNRWSGPGVFRNPGKYKLTLNQQLAGEGRSRILFYNVIEMFIYLVFAGSFYWFSEASLSAAIVTFVMAMELLFFHLINQRFFRIGVNENSLILLSRQTIIVPFKGLKKAEKDFNEWFFSYRDGTVKKIPLVHLTPDQQSEILKEVRELPACSHVFFADSLNDGN